MRAAHALGDRLLGRLVSQAGLTLIHRAVSVARSLARNDQGLWTTTTIATFFHTFRSHRSAPATLKRAAIKA